MSSTVLQKQVGQASVQLPQLRHLDATSSQRAASWLAAISSRKPVSGMARPICSAAPVTAARARFTAPSRLVGTPAIPGVTGVPMSTVNECRRRRQLVSASRGPARGRARFPMDAEAPPAAVHRHDEHLPARVARVAAARCRHLVLDLDGPQVGRPDPEERQPGRRHVVRAELDPTVGQAG
jgi:hypothetical protein